MNNDLDVVQNTLLKKVVRDKFKDCDYNNIKLIKSTTYPYSSIRIVKFTDEKRNPVILFIKRITIPKKKLADVREKLECEASLLQLLNKEMSGEAVELIEIFPEQKIIVTKKCAGSAIDTLMNAYTFWWKNDSAQKESRDNLALLCGSWLKRYHLATGRKNKDLEPWYDYLSGEMLWRTRALKESLPEHSQLFSEVSEMFRARLKEIQHQGYACTYHGDFSGHNIFYEKDSIKVIDFYDAKIGHPFIDLINFIASLAYRSENPLYPKQRIGIFCRNFFKGYGEMLEQNKELVYLLLLLQCIKRLHVITSNQKIRLDRKLLNQRVIKQYTHYLNNHLQETNNRQKIEPWPFLNLTNLTCSTR
ncbi:MAG: phosphotransferase [Candidatus Reddybacter sp.]